MTIMNIIKTAYINLSENGVTLTSYLAHERNVDGVKKALELGGKREDAIYGAAWAGDVEQVNLYLEECSEDEKQACFASAVKGYARAGAAGEKALSDFPNVQSSPELIIGWAQAGKKEQLDRAVAHNLTLLHYVVEGYAETNREKDLKNILKGTRFHSKAIFYAARAGNRNLVTELLKDFGINPEDRIIINEKGRLRSSEQEIEKIERYTLFSEAARGYVEGRHFKEAAAMLDRGANTSLSLGQLPVDDVESQLILLCYAKNKDVAALLLERIKQNYSVKNDKEIPINLVDDALKIRDLMSSQNINYLEAKNKLEPDVDGYLPDQKDITLSYLLEALHEAHTSSRVKRGIP
jgi:hypothetical protein